MKIAPLLRACKKKAHIKTLLIHTGQHYDSSLSEVFFKELGIKVPDIQFLPPESSDREEQIDHMAKQIVEYCKDKHASVIVVVGDVNSTLAGATAGKTLDIPVAHVEAGLRSNDVRMPEEHNRIATDKIARFHFVTEPDGIKNLKREKLYNKTTFLVGNVMIDTLYYELPRIKSCNMLSTFKVSPKDYVVLTLHRKENLENVKIFTDLLGMIYAISERKHIVWPIHPRTYKRLEELNLLEEVKSHSAITLSEPLGYIEFVSLVKDSLCVVTDSGGIQDETAILNIPCLTIRRTTERPITASRGSSTLIGENGEKLMTKFEQILSGKYKKSRIPKYWDGHTSERIVEKLDLLN